MSIARNIRDIYRDINQPGSLAKIISLTVREPKNAEALYYAGICYYQGKGVQKDYHKAFEYFKKAAALNHPAACYMVGMCFENGHGVEINFKKASYVYAKAAEKNGDYLDHNGRSPGIEAIQCLHELLNNCILSDESVILSNLAYCYENGYCLPQDSIEAKKLYQRAIELGNSMSMISLASLYIEGRPGISINIMRGLKLFREAIDKNPNYSAKLSKYLEKMIEDHPDYRKNIEELLLECYERCGDYYKCHRYLSDSIAFYQQLLRKQDISGIERVNTIYRVTQLFRSLLGCEVSVLRDRLCEQRAEGEREDSLVTSRLILLMERLRKHKVELHHTAYDADKIESIKTKYRVDAASILKYLQFYREAERFAKSIQKELMFIRERIIHPVTPWQVKNMFKQWVDGMPRGMQEILTLLQTIENANADEVLKIYRQVLEKLASRVDYDLFDRHQAVKNFYEEVFESLQLYVFPAEAVAKKTPMPITPQVTADVKENHAATTVAEQSNGFVAFVPASQFYFIPIVDTSSPSAPELTTQPQVFITTTQLQSTLTAVQPPPHLMSTNQFSFWMNQCPAVPARDVQQTESLNPVYVATHRKSAVLS